MLAPKSIEISFQLTQQEIYQANIAIALRRYNTLIWLLVFFAAFIFLLFVTAIHSSASALRGFTPGTVLLTILAPVFFIAMLFWSAQAAARATFRANPSLQGPTLWSFSEDGIVTVGPAGRTQLQWTNYFLARETGTLFLLFPQQHLANVIPKRAFANDQEIAAFRELLAKQNLPLA
jgi:hypothetical protein